MEKTCLERWSNFPLDRTTVTWWNMDLNPGVTPALMSCSTMHPWNSCLLPFLTFWCHFFLHFPHSFLLNALANILETCMSPYSLNHLLFSFSWLVALGCSFTFRFNGILEGSGLSCISSGEVFKDTCLLSDLFLTVSQVLANTTMLCFTRLGIFPSFISLSLSILTTWVCTVT